MAKAFIPLDKLCDRIQYARKIKSGNTEKWITPSQKWKTQQMGEWFSGNNLVFDKISILKPKDPESKRVLYQFSNAARREPRRDRGTLRFFGDSPFLPFLSLMTKQVMAKLNEIISN